MTRHGKNATSNPVYTHAEKQKDCREGLYGSQVARIGADSIKAFDTCSLTLQRCIDPVITPHGFLYDKQAILEYILHQKRLIARRLKLYNETLTKAKTAEKRQADDQVHEDTVGKFLKRNSGVAVATSINPHTGLPNNTLTARSETGAPKLEILPGQPVKSFWIPAQTPDASFIFSKNEAAIEAARISQKPTEIVHCPMSGRPLKLRDLIEVKLTLADNSFATNAAVGPESKERIERGTASNVTLYKCPVTHDQLRNSTPCAVIKPTGLLIKLDAVEKIIRPNGMRDPISGLVLKENDIIPVQRGGTGFTAAVRDGKQLAPKINRPAMPSA